MSEEDEMITAVSYLEEMADHDYEPLVLHSPYDHKWHFFSKGAQNETIGVSLFDAVDKAYRNWLAQEPKEEEHV